MTETEEAALERLTLPELAEVLARKFLKAHPDRENLYRSIVDLVECPLLRTLMRESHGNISQVAEKLGVHRTTARTRLRRHGLSKKSVPV